MNAGDDVAEVGASLQAEVAALHAELPAKSSSWARQALAADRTGD